MARRGQIGFLLVSRVSHGYPASVLSSCPKRVSQWSSAVPNWLFRSLLEQRTDRELKDPFAFSWVGIQINPIRGAEGAKG